MRLQSLLISSLVRYCSCERTPFTYIISTYPLINDSLIFASWVYAVIIHIHKILCWWLLHIWALFCFSGDMVTCERVCGIYTPQFNSIFLQPHSNFSISTGSLKKSLLCCWLQNKTMFFSFVLELP